MTTLGTLGTLGTLTLVAGLGCGGSGAGPRDTTAAGGTAGSSVSVPIAARSNASLDGKVTLEPLADGVKVTVVVSGWSAPGPKGVHLHETADCSAADAESAGDHWNPSSQPHGMPEHPQHHAGDLGNIEVAADGAGTLTVTVPGVTLTPGPSSLLGRALVVHADADDGTSQPAGNSGDRVGCAELR